MFEGAGMEVHLEKLAINPKSFDDPGVLIGLVYGLFDTCHFKISEHCYEPCLIDGSVQNQIDTMGFYSPLEKSAL